MGSHKNYHNHRLFSQNYFLLGIKQLISDSFTDFADSNKKGDRVTAKVISHSEERIDLELSDGVKGYMPMKDYSNSMSDSPLENDSLIDVVIANINKKDREIILSLRALEKQEEKSALKDNAQKNKEIEEATSSNLGDLIKAEMQDIEKMDD